MWFTVARVHAICKEKARNASNFTRTFNPPDHSLQTCAPLRTFIRVPGCEYGRSLCGNEIRTADVCGQIRTAGSPPAAPRRVDHGSPFNQKKRTTWAQP